MPKIIERYLGDKKVWEDKENLVGGFYRSGTSLLYFFSFKEKIREKEKVKVYANVKDKQKLHFMKTIGSDYQKIQMIIHKPILENGKKYEEFFFDNSLFADGVVVEWNTFDGMCGIAIYSEVAVNPEELNLRVYKV